MFRIILLLTIVSSMAHGQQSREGYKLVKLTIRQDQREYAAQLDSQPNIDVWDTGKDFVTLALPPDTQQKYLAEFKSRQMTYEILSENIQSMIQEQLNSMTSRARAATTDIKGRYVRYTDILNDIGNTIIKNPDIASIYKAGWTSENRYIPVIVLKTKTSTRSVWIDCGIHAREWVAVSTCVYIYKTLIEEYRSNPTKSLLNNYEFHIMPIVNVDGYEYTWTNDRLWRKNRRKNAGSSCVGVDPNRNFDYGWLQGGSSTNPCSEVYAGSGAGSEAEVKAVKDSINKKLGNWVALFTLHSYGQYWFTTWGYTEQLPPNYNEILPYVKIGVAGIKAASGATFTYGSSAKLLYIASGGTEDWGTAKIPYAFCLELRPSDSTSDPDYKYGFLLPEARASLAGNETYAGIKAFLGAVIGK